MTIHRRSPDGRRLVAFARFGLFDKMEPRHLAQRIRVSLQSPFLSACLVRSVLFRHPTTRIVARGNNPYFSSAEAFKTALRIGDRKVRRQAKKSIKGARPAQGLRQRGLARDEAYLVILAENAVFSSPRQLQSPNHNNLLSHGS